MDRRLQIVFDQGSRNTQHGVTTAPQLPLPSRICLGAVDRHAIDFDDERDLSCKEVDD